MMKQASKKEKNICTMTSFYDQNPSGCCYLVQIRAFDLAGISKFKKIYMKGKNKQQKDSGRSSKSNATVQMHSIRWQI